MKTIEKILDVIHENGETIQSLQEDVSAKFGYVPYSTIRSAVKANKGIDAKLTTNAFGLIVKNQFYRPKTSPKKITFRGEEVQVKPETLEMLQQHFPLFEVVAKMASINMYLDGKLKRRVYDYIGRLEVEFFNAEGEQAPTKVFHNANAEQDMVRAINAFDSHDDGYRVIYESEAVYLNGELSDVATVKIDKNECRYIVQMKHSRAIVQIISINVSRHYDLTFFNPHNQSIQEKQADSLAEIVGLIKEFNLE